MSHIRILLVFTALLGGNIGPAAAEYRKGWDAWVSQGVEAAEAVAREDALAGDAAAQTFYGGFLRSRNGFSKAVRERRRREALDWFHKSAAQGYVGAYIALQTVYRNGEGTAVDLKEAHRWTVKAAAAGCWGAQLELGEAYSLGRQEEVDFTQARHWYLLAARQNIGESQSRLGDLYQQGLGGAQDWLEAFKWYHIAATNTRSNDFRRERDAGKRERLAAGMTREQIAEATARAEAWIARPVPVAEPRDC